MMMGSLEAHIARLRLYLNMLGDVFACTDTDLQDAWRMGAKFSHRYADAVGVPRCNEEDSKINFLSESRSIRYRVMERDG